MSRTQQREHYPLDVRIPLLEQDIDALERAVSRMSQLMTGLLFSIATAAVMLAINVVGKIPR